MACSRRAEVSGTLFIFSLCVSGHALQCYKCDLGLGSFCTANKTTCQAGESCFNGNGTAAGVIKFTQKGCLAVADCNKTSNFTLPGSSDTTIYQMYKTCCSTDLCNGDTLTPLNNTLKPLNNTLTPLNNTLTPLNNTLTPLNNTHTPLTNTLTLTIGSLVSLLLAKMLM
ncbi:prostate stem cell antigen-like [Trichomycterus rosablanca]|uniref:prostate stem cell antigen-like n=1 Tax=Trichomycterus rosablanca TaxID=2290929 RepID=UPI002F3549C7